MRFAKELVSSVTASTRPKLVAGAHASSSRRSAADEEKKLVAALAKIGVDWSRPPAADAATANLDVSLATTPTGTVKAGDDDHADRDRQEHRHRRRVPRAAARSRPTTACSRMSSCRSARSAPARPRRSPRSSRSRKDALDRVDRLGARGPRGAQRAGRTSTPAEVHIEAAPRPVFAYAWQLDRRGQRRRPRPARRAVPACRSRSRTPAPAPTQEATVLLRNATGDGVDARQVARSSSRTPLAPGQTKEVEFPLATDATLKADEIVVELMAYDSDARRPGQRQAALQGRRRRSPADAAHGDVTVKQRSRDPRGRRGRHERRRQRAAAARATRRSARSAPWTKVKLNAGGSRSASCRRASVTAGGSGTGTFARDVELDAAADHARRRRASRPTPIPTSSTGTVTDEQHVEDVYIFVSNQSAKIESRKVFYRSNRGGKDGKLLDFATDLPLWPGSNMVTVVARVELARSAR